MNRSTLSGKPTSRNFLAGAGLLACALACLACLLALPPVYSFLISFPESMLGQVTLARETKPLPPPAYLSAEFVLNQVAASDVAQAELVVLGEDVLFWDPWYVGFPRAGLTGEEISVVQDWLSAGRLLHPSPSGESHQCVANQPGQTPVLEPCPQAGAYLDQFVSLEQEAVQRQAVAVLVMFLSDGRLVEIRLYPSPSGLAYQPVEKGGEWWLYGVAAALPLIDQVAARAVVSPVEVLWPELTADQANRRAARIIGSHYQPALVSLQNSSALRSVFGEIQDIRPANGTNTYASWMDSTSVTLTFRVTGVHGEGAALVQGYNCFDLQMVFRGPTVQDGEFYVCP